MIARDVDVSSLAEHSEPVLNEQAKNLFISNTDFSYIGGSEPAPATPAANDTIKNTTNNTTVAKSEQSMTVKARSKTVKASKLKKKKQTVKKAIAVKNAKGKVTYAKVKKGSSKALSISKKGVITVKKGKYKKKATLKINVKVTAAGNDKFLPGSKTVTVKIKVK